MLNDKKKNKKFLFFGLILSIGLQGCSILSGGKVKPTDAITTNIKDAYPIAHWLEYYTNIRSAEEGTNFNLSPGYYTFDIQSYCLKAGTYAPIAGSGYLIAPLKGERAKIIANVLRKSENHPNINQRDIQRLIWGIETGVNFRKYSTSFQLKVGPVLSPGEIAALSVDYEDLFDKVLPDEIKEIIGLYQRMREMVTDVQTTYEQLEAVAVLTGIAPLGPGSRDIKPGPWAYAGNGFYMRVFPAGYSSTTLEVIRSAPYSLERDESGRITVFESGKYRIETSYDDSPDASVISAPGKPNIHIWRFKKVRFVGPEPEHDLTIENKGWILRSSQPSEIADRSTSPLRNASRYLQFASLDNRIFLAQGDIIPKEWKDAKDRYDKAKEHKDLYDKIDDYYEDQDRGERPPSEDAIDDITDLDHYKDGLDSATDPGDIEGRSEWLTEHFERLMDAWNYANCVLAGDCPPPGERPDDSDDESDEFDPTDQVATPANTSRQRLGLSRRSR